MATFTWEGVSRNGTAQRGTTRSPSRDTLAASLRKKGVRLTDASEAKEKGKGFSLPGLRGGRVPEKDIVIFTRQFATMIDAGLPLVQCLEILGTQTENPSFAKVLQKVKADVEEGATYADALSRHPKVFNNLYVNMVAAGEAGGILDVILNRLAAYIEKAMALKRQVKSAMTYPAVVVTIAIAIIGVIMVFVIPSFAKMFGSFGATLPLPTRMVIAMSNFMVHNILFILMGIAGFIWAFKMWYATPVGRRIVHKTLLRTPIFGILIRKVAVSKFTRTMSTLMSSGVPIIAGLDIVAKTSGNAVVEEAIGSVAASLKEGKTMAEPLAETNVFPPMVVQMIGVGEKTGALDAMLAKIADFYDEEVDTAVSALTSMLEPLLMVFLGTSIGFIIVAMYLPIFKVASVVG
ncbi:MAG: pilus assembly protein PilC [Nitrospirae bacterium CG18_big_fil_WC_8_21_14_2_50_70_55]|nr:type II secretion system F family protein [Deltaproteobacteria bacterium]OIP65657.1 MAG: pilus assembly protein PilC [Nitrospirae bacterium CG2_30_70_394]PIQ05872.1 MAG: pilus assembly protein PilC [Nitrospirae bacterium CG18_big_fil_WC_8_21_14_2_50_70_55]PIU77651.1 MAG: pilus assembly protein PilC [Nitrospirae bacterium CG06_land_8_20_14_3_00_70_43]PIW82844.1 MAG: pilus assembly protein PilC [Nitrospirae bacterium CG_4_8_14_3_um_filter_70_85]PIX82533.1 MAG: pilus assembly protein PilC [Nit